MYINLLAAVAVTSVMAGQAGAATYTVAEYDMQIRYEGTGFTDAYILSLYDLDVDTIFEGDIALGDTTFGFESYLFGKPQVGTVFQFQFKVVHPHEPIEELFYGNGGRAPVCQLGPWDCTNVNNTNINGNHISFAWEDAFSSSVHLTKGSVISINFWSEFASHNGPFPFFLSEDGLYGYDYWDEYSQFTILDIKDLAPVPLPSAIALLPLSLGALAFMRKRRRPAAG